MPLPYDPRPDIKEDHPLWVILLLDAVQMNRQLAGILHGMRCGGAVITVNARGNYVLRPGVGSDKYGETETEAVEKWKADTGKWLAPYKDELKELLQKLEVEVRRRKQVERENRRRR